MLEIIEYLAYIIEGYCVWLYDIITRRKSKRTQMRIDTCRKCEHNKSGICELCGCVIKAKVRVDYELDENDKSIDGCPEKRW